MKKIRFNTDFGLAKSRTRILRVEGVYEFLSANPVDVDRSTVFFLERQCYTRNLIYKDERFEMMAICWDKGQISRVHNHADQKCWMTVPIGRLHGQNFAVDEIGRISGHTAS